MRPFLLAFVDTQAFTIIMTLLLVGIVVLVCAIAVGLFVSTRQGLRQWRALGAEPGDTPPRLKAALSLLPAAALLLAGTWYIGTTLYKFHQQGQQWDLLQRQKAALGQQLPGCYVLADSSLCDPKLTRVVQGGVSDWGSSLPDTAVVMPHQLGHQNSIPCAELLIRADGTYTYRSSLAGDAASWLHTGIWKLEHTDENIPDDSDYGIGGYVPVFYRGVPGGSLERTGGVLVGRPAGSHISLLGSYHDPQGRFIQFELTRQPSSGTPPSWPVR